MIPNIDIEWNKTIVSFKMGIIYQVLNVIHLIYQLLLIQEGAVVCQTLKCSSVTCWNPGVACGQSCPQCCFGLHVLIVILFSCRMDQLCARPRPVLRSPVVILRFLVDGAAPSVERRCVSSRAAAYLRGRDSATPPTAVRRVCAGRAGCSVRARSVLQSPVLTHGR